MRRGDALALARWHSLDPEAGIFQPRMADVQYLVAWEYGFESWRKLNPFDTASRFLAARPETRAHSDCQSNCQLPHTQSRQRASEWPLPRDPLLVLPVGLNRGSIYSLLRPTRSFGLPA
jgi:hypothetical protein